MLPPGASAGKEVEFVRQEMSKHRAAYELEDGEAPAIRSLEAIEGDAALRAAALEAELGGTRRTCEELCAHFELAVFLTTEPTR